jgi:hypothetical protein
MNGSFRDRVASEIEDDGRARALLTKYHWRDDEGRYRYTGANFDRLDGSDIRNEANRFMPSDLVAVTMLSVDVPGRTSADLLAGPASVLTAQLLAEIGPDRDIWVAKEAEIDDGSPAHQLWSALEAMNGIGWVTANKLLARKRPRLLPVYDSVVKEALRPKPGQFWVSLRHALLDPTLRSSLESIRDGVPEAEHLSVLRVLDIVVWMNHLGDGQVAA